MDIGLFLEFPRREQQTTYQAFQEGLNIVDEAERLGVKSVWLAEYHFNPGRVLSAPITIASNLAGRTKSIRIGLAVHILPLSNPVRVAEEIATLDHLSNGRIDFGIGRGTFPNVHEGYGVPFEESRDRFAENLEIIIGAWTNDRFTFQGKYFNCNDLQIEPKPLQNPYPPIKVGVTSAESFPIIGALGFPIFVNPSRVFNLDDLSLPINEYRKAWREAGHMGNGYVGVRIPIYLADNKQDAYVAPKDSAMFSAHRLGARVASYAGQQGTSGNWGLEGDRILQMNYDQWLDNKVVFGDPDSVTQRLIQLRDSLGIDQLVYEINLGNQLTYEQQIHSLRLFNSEVLPHLIPIVKS